MMAARITGGSPLRAEGGCGWRWAALSVFRSTRCRPRRARASNWQTAMSAKRSCCGYFAVRTSAKVQTHLVDSSIESGTRDDASDAIERYDHGWVAGAGYDIGRLIVVEGRYTRGLANVNRVPDSVGFTNRALTFMVGFRY